MSKCMHEPCKKPTSLDTWCMYVVAMTLWANLDGIENKDTARVEIRKKKKLGSNTRSGTTQCAQGKNNVKN